MLMNENGQVKLCDMGLAKTVTAASFLHSIAARFPCGRTEVHQMEKPLWFRLMSRAL